MQVKSLIFSLLVFNSFLCFSQGNSIEMFNQQKQQINRNGMLVLGGWSISNIAYNAIAGANATGSKQYFHQMNLIWGGINLGLSTIGFLGSKKKVVANTGQTFRQQSIVEKTFIFNAGLDVAYIVGGLYLKEKANNKPMDYDRLKGYGQSIIVQGAALLLFDGIMFAVHTHHGKKLYNQTGLQLAVTGNGIGFVLPL